MLRCVAIMVVACLPASGGCQTGRESDSPRGGQVQEGRASMAQSVRDKILAGDWSAAETAKQVGPPAVAQIRDLLTNEDRRVRIITMTSIEEAGGPDAAPALAEGLLDADQQGRTTAARGLHKHPDPTLYRRFLEIYDESKDPYVKQQIPIIIARNEGKIADYSGLVERWDREQDPTAREGLTVGLAKLGHEPARAEFVQRLHGATGPSLDQYLKHSEFIHQQWLLKGLAPILLDETKLRYLGPHGKDVDLRACDIALNLIGDIAGWRFSFKQSARANYTPEQRTEVKSWVERQP